MMPTITRKPARTPISSLQLPTIEPHLKAALERDILARGILIPVILSEDGEILDGRIRSEIATRHKLSLPKIVVGRLTGEDRDGLRISLNTLRRHLTRDQIRTMISWELRRTPTASDRAVAGRVGADNKTVASVRRQSGEEVPHLRIGKDGKKYPTHPKPVVTTLNEGQAAEASRLLGSLRDVPNKRLSVGTLRTMEYRERRQREAEGPQGSLPACITIQKNDFQSFDWKPWIGRTSLVCVDPPWAKEFAHLRKPLVDLAGRLLREGGVLCVYTGQHHLGEWITALGETLTYRWVIASVNEGSPRILHNGKGRTPIYSGWRPILVASKGELKNNRLFHDVLRYGQEKAHHEWQQPADEARRLVEMFSKEGETVIDPCCGSGSSLLGILAAGGGRIGVGVDVDGEAVKVARKRLGEFSS